MKYKPQLPDASKCKAEIELEGARIGIILAGGGAKGAYQAGAMQAIYDFLEENGAVNNVRMIAGTSIGAWNALFWLADLTKAPADGKSLLQSWWESMAVGPLIVPDIYVPTVKNSFLTTIPWQENFEAIFSQNEAIKERLQRHLSGADDRINFYLTRSNVGRARLEFTTNRDDLQHAHPKMPGTRPRPAVEPNTWKVAKTIQDLKTAVFSSMDLPPLFPYFTIDDGLFEDGGVVDNLPLRFATELEDCDFLFVLPLNATFNEKVNRNSLIRRLFRVMDMRQGVLERNAFKQTYLFNELARLRHELENRDDALRTLAETALTSENGKVQMEATKVLESLVSGCSRDAISQMQTVIQAQQRKHKPVRIFAICPSPELEINTAEFWKTQQAGRAFRFMFRETKAKLTEYFRDPPELIGMYRVSPQGDSDFYTDF